MVTTKAGAVVALESNSPRVEEIAVASAGGPARRIRLPPESRIAWTQARA